MYVIYSKVIVITGEDGKSEVCHEGEKQISDEIQQKPTGTVILVGTSDLPAHHDGKYSQEDVAKDYKANGKLTSTHFGAYTPPPPTPVPTPAPAQSAVPRQTQTPKPTPAPARTSSSAYYKNCTAARDAGAAPVHAGQPGYGRHLDRDGDGVGCE